jgi:tetrachlorobenzoquinone reductase
VSESERELRVERLSRLADGVVEVRLADPSGAPLPAWEPGAHIDLTLPGELIRQYSLCGDPDDRGTWTIAVHRSPTSRGGSAFVHEQLRIDARVTVKGPRNHFPLEEAGSHLLVAGGIGVTPILAMARRLAATGADWRLVYCARSRSMMAYADEVVALGGDRVRLHADDETGGPLDLAALLAGHPGATVHCCGPGPMLDAVERLAPDPGLVRVERFQAAEQAPRAEPDGAFDVLCGRSGPRIRIEPGESVMDRLERAGFPIPSSCREGVCGTCETKVLAGVPDHRDSVLTAAERAENTSMLVCVSRSLTPEIVLDLP